ncbi:MAG: flavin reductase family protein [Conexivisphaera sp.]
MEYLLKAFMRRAAQQVYAVTARGSEGYAALTATSVTSVSLRPPLMVVAVARESRSYRALIAADHFIISMLGAGPRGERASSVLAESRDPEEKLKLVGYRDTPWGPVVEGSIGYLALRRYSSCAGGDHELILGEVVGGEPPTGCPLVYTERGYAALAGCPGDEAA